MPKAFLFVLGALIFFSREGVGMVHDNPFWQNVEWNFQRGDNQKVCATIRSTPDEIKKPEGDNLARLYLMSVQDNGPVLDDHTQEQESKERFKSFLEGRGAAGFPFYLVLAHWHLKSPIGPMSGRAPFPEDFDSYFRDHYHIPQDYKQGLKILMENPTPHSYYWLGQWYKGSSQFLSRAMGWGILSMIAERKLHREAMKETKKRLKMIEKDNRPGWREACAAWFLCPDRACPSDDGIGYDFRRFDLRGFCGIGDYRKDGWCEWNCLCFGCRTKFHYKELWRRTADLSSRIGAASRTSLMWLGGGTTLAGTILGNYGINNTDDSATANGNFLAISGTAVLLVAYTSFPTEDTQNPTAPSVPSYAYGAQPQEADGRTVPPSTYASAYPSAPGTRMPSAVYSPSEREDSPEPPTGESLLRGFVRRSVKSLQDLRRSFRNRGNAEIAPLDQVVVDTPRAMRPVPPAPITTQPRIQEAPLPPLEFEGDLEALERGFAQVVSSRNMVDAYSIGQSLADFDLDRPPFMEPPVMTQTDLSMVENL